MIYADTYFANFFYNSVRTLQDGRAFLPNEHAPERTVFMLQWK